MAEAPLSALLSAMGGVLLYPLVGLQWNAAARTAHTAQHTAHTPEALHGAAARRTALPALGSWLAARGYPAWLAALYGGRTSAPRSRRPSRGGRPKPDKFLAFLTPNPNPNPSPSPSPTPTPRPKPDKFLAFLLTLVLEGFASGGLGLFLGATAPSTDAALAMFPPLLVLMIIFNGFNISPEATPRLLRFIPKVSYTSPYLPISPHISIHLPISPYIIPKVSFIRWCSEGLAVNEFSGLRFSCDGVRGPCAETGEQALERVSMRSTVRKANMAQGGIIAGCYAGTYHALRRNRPKFLSIVSPKAVPIAKVPVPTGAGSSGRS